MSDEFSEVYEIDNDETEETRNSGGPKALREAYDKAQARIRELEERDAKREAEARQSKLVDALNSAGVNPLVADLVPESVGPDGVDEWLSKYGPALGTAPQEQQPPVEEQPPASPLTPEVAAALQAVTGDPEGSPANVSPDDFAKVNSFTTKDEFYAFLRSQRPEISPQ